MGQQQTSVYSQTEYLKQQILDDEWLSSDDVITIDLAQDTFKNPTKNKYNIKLKSDIPSNCDMCVLFANNRKALWTKSYLGHLNTFSTELNSRIGRSQEIRISSGDKYYKFVGFVGNLYLWWGEKVNIERINHLQNEIMENVPLLVETNGEMSVRSVYLFGLNEIVNLEDVILNEPIMYPLYCCETDFRKNNHKTIRTVTDKLVDQRIEDTVLRRLKELPEDELPFGEVEQIATERIPTFVGLNLEDDEH